MKCKIIIKTVDSTGKSLFEGDGEYITDGGERVVEYLYGDAPCKIIIRGDGLTQIHGGDMNLNVTFTEGQTTLCSFSEGELTGGYGVFTKKLAVSERAGVIFARVLYHVADDSSLFTDVTLRVIPEKF